VGEFSHHVDRPGELPVDEGVGARRLAKTLHDPTAYVTASTAGAE